MHLIADHSGVMDVVALRLVSKHLLYLLNDRGIWKKFYARGRALHLPPGPYDWQPTSYLIKVLVRATRFYSVWPSSWKCPRTCDTPYTINFERVPFTVLLGRWLLRANGSTILCHDSRCRDPSGPVKTLFDFSESGPIRGLSSSGSVQEDGVQAFVAILFHNHFTVMKVIVDQETLRSVQFVIPSTPTNAGRYGSVRVGLYHRLLVVRVEKSGLDPPRNQIIMDIDTRRRYHISPTTYDEVVRRKPGWKGSSTSSLVATKTHLIRLAEIHRRYKIQSYVECFPLPLNNDAHASDVLRLSHRRRINKPRLRKCSVIHESPIDPENGEASFVLCGLRFPVDADLRPRGALEVMEVHLEPNGVVSLTRRSLTTPTVASFCIGSRNGRSCGVMLKEDMSTLSFAFALDYHGPGFLSIKLSELQPKHNLSEWQVIALDAFEDTAFYANVLLTTEVTMVDFTRDVVKSMEGRTREYIFLGDKTYYRRNSDRELELGFTS